MFSLAKAVVAGSFPPSSVRAVASGPSGFLTSISSSQIAQLSHVPTGQHQQRALQLLIVAVLWTHSFSKKLIKQLPVYG